MPLTISIFSDRVVSERADIEKHAIPMVKRVLIIVVILGVIILASLFTISTGLQNAREINVVHTSLDSKEVDKQPIRIAFLSDFHITWNDSSFERLEEIIKRVKKSSPDLILLGGDFTGEGHAATHMIRNQIVSSLNALSDIAPTYTVLGNHEWWTGGDEWVEAIKNSEIHLIEGHQKLLTINGREICLRGLGDAYTNHYKPQPFRDDCTGLKVTLTHDPYAVELDSEQGIFFSGHTHCSQIRLRSIRAFWTPTKADESLWCGWTLHNGRASLTTAGLGTSIIPLRLGTTAGFDVVTIQ